MSELEDMLGGILSDPKQMQKIAEMASSLMGGSEAPPPKEEKPSADLLGGLTDLPLGDMMGMAKKLLGSGGGGNQKTAVLSAMKPWMSENRASKLEKAIKLASLMKVALTFFKNSEGLL